MLDVTVRLLTAWMGSPEYGTNAIAATLPRTNLGGKPDDAAPRVVSFYSDADNLGVAADGDPPSVPALILWSDSFDTVKNQVYKTATQVTFGVGYVTGETDDALTSTRECGYILRGARISFMRHFNSLEKSKDYRQLDGIMIISIDECVEHRVTVAVGRRKMWGFLEVKTTVVDTLA